MVIEAGHIQPHEAHNSEVVEQRAVPAVAEPVVAFVLPPGAEQATINSRKGKDKALSPERKVLILSITCWGSVWG